MQKEADTERIEETVKGYAQIDESVRGNGGHGMSVCKDCIHFDACVAFLNSEIDIVPLEDSIERHSNDEICDHQPCCYCHDHSSWVKGEEDDDHQQKEV